MLRICSLLVLILGLSAVIAAPAPATAPPLRGELRVIDGDTFDIGGARVRLHGVDAPERAQTCRDAQGRDWRCGDWSGRALRELVRGRQVSCRDLGERTHGRVVAQCSLGGEDLAALLIASGVVRACPRYAERHAHSRGYARIEAGAMVRRVGLHAGETPARAGFCGPQAVPVTETATETGCRIKGNISANGRIYHLPGQRDYERTRIDTARGERWFCSEAEARAAGWRRARR